MIQLLPLILLLHCIITDIFNYTLGWPTNERQDCNDLFVKVYSNG